MEESKDNRIQVSEAFYSCQCEGITTGVPSIFIRLTTCNLSCGMSTAMLREGTKHGFGDPGQFRGDLHKEGKATWTCDTIPVWVKGTWMTYEELEQKFIDFGVMDWVLDSKVHLIWTGGEPTIPKHQKAIMGFLDY